MQRAAPAATVAPAEITQGDRPAARNLTVLARAVITLAVLPT